MSVAMMAPASKWLGVDENLTTNDHNGGLRALDDLSSLVALLADRTDQAYRQLADWPTVMAHLVQAQDHCHKMRRSLKHAYGTLQYNAAGVCAPHGSLGAHAEAKSIS